MTTSLHAYMSKCDDPKSPKNVGTAFALGHPSPVDERIGVQVEVGDGLGLEDTTS